MKKTILAFLIVLAFVFSVQVVSACGSCGCGGSKEKTKEPSKKGK